MTLDELFDLEYISVRSSNVCFGNGLRNLSDIQEYFEKNKSFLKLRNCGRKSNEELIAFCLKYINKNDDYPNERNSEKDLFESLIINLTKTQRDILNNYLEVSTIALSGRSRRALNYILNKKVNLQSISDIILSNDQFKFRDLKNVGNKSTIELQEFISNFVNLIFKSTNRELSSLINEHLINQFFAISIIPSDVFESKYFFKITDFIIKQNVIFEKNQNTIFQKGFNVFNSLKETTTDSIAFELKMSRERVRQIRKTLIRDIAMKFQFIKYFEEDLFQNYNIDITEDLLIVDHDLSNVINNKAGVDFTKEFISFLLSVYVSEKFKLIGNIEDILIIKHRNSKNKFISKNLYLINKSLNKTFDFNAFIKDISKRFYERIDVSYSLNIKGYIMNFVKINDYTSLTRILPIAENILNKEFDIFIDLSDNINFNRNTTKQVPEYVIEVLNKLGVPTNLEEIYRIIEKEYPGVTKSQDALRGSIQRTPQIIYFGRSSTYGLKKWENERTGIKGGTIKNIVIDYLSNKQTPVHIYELLTEVNRYRKTNAKNIITNLKLDPLKQFSIFNQSFVGLSKIHYDSNLTTLPKSLGKTITKQIKQHGPINRQSFEKHLSDICGIDAINCFNIVQQLIDNVCLKIDNQDNLYI